MCWLSVNENNELLWPGRCGVESVFKKARAPDAGLEKLEGRNWQRADVFHIQLLFGNDENVV